MKRLFVGLVGVTMIVQGLHKDFANRLVDQSMAIAGLSIVLLNLKRQPRM